MAAAETLNKETNEGAETEDENRQTSDGAEEFQDAPETLASADGGDPMDVDKDDPNNEGERAHFLNASETRGDPAVVAEENLDGEEEKVCVQNASETLVSVDGGDSAVVSQENLYRDGEKVPFQDDSETLVPLEGGNSTDAGKESLNGDREKDCVQNSSETLISVGGDSTMVAKENTIGNGEKVPDLEETGLESVDAVERDGGDPLTRYYLPCADDNAGFSAPDMIWGKVKSHPWWPGQIFDPKYASDLASKHQKKDHLLVAYFGDKTFAWCEQSQLKPFGLAFAQMERQTGMDAFTNAVEAAVEEVSRRVELGMSCLCVAAETYTNLKYQVVENAGIREGTCSSVMDKGLIVNSFEPERLLEFVEALARCPSWGPNRLELATAKAQVKGFYRSKGHPELPAFVVGGGLLDNDIEVTPPKSEKSGKSNVEDSVVKRSRGRPKKLKDVSGKKLTDVSEKKLKDVPEDAKEDTKALNDDSATISGKKRPRGRPRKVQNASENGKGGAFGGKSTPHAPDKKHEDDDPDSGGGRKSRKRRVDYLEMVSPSSARSRSVKIGERIRKVASQVQGSLPIFKSNSEELQSTESTSKKRVTKNEFDSTDEMLSQLCFVAADPMGSYSFLSRTMSFFTDYRATISTDSSEELMPSKSKGGKRGRKKKIVDSEPESSDVPMADSYWNDLLLQSSPEREPVSRGRKRKKGSKGKKQKKAKSAAIVDKEQGPMVNTSSPSATDHQEMAGEGPSSYISGKVEEAEEGPNTDVAAKIKGAGETPISDAVEKIEQAGEGSGNGSVETPTALILSFTEPDALPTEADLMRIFSRYGPLKEAETEVLRKTNRAKVVFKSRIDAELAFSSAGKYSAFGPALVSYRLRYLQPLSKGSPCNSAQDRDTTHTEVGSTELPAKEDNSVATGNTSVQVMGNLSKE
ncbi:uncharacterized protein M6B38_152930 [Iris pallida]|uniref:PWWP domain-containing protein n=1 Tax=Iris pallida TaxID=29817 RepID=A0AAX6F628_IRIPA|nr:uncharacterized protein M6B38_152930 [Iris pallida]